MINLIVVISEIIIFEKKKETIIKTTKCKNCFNIIIIFFKREITFNYKIFFAHI